MAISYNGFNSKVMTFKANSNTKVGQPITVNSTGEATQVPTGSEFLGICVTVRNDLAGVQLEGYIEKKYSGNAPTLGWCSLVGNGSGNIKVGEATNHKYRVIKVDTANNIVGFIL